MKSWSLQKSSVVVLTLLLLVATSGYSETVEEGGALSQNKALLINAMGALFNDHDSDAAKALFRDDYIQHNPNVPDGLAPILGIIPALKEAEFSYEVHRIIADGDLVLTHSTASNAEFFGANQVVAFDLWRVEDGKVAEHWDSIIPVYKETASGRSQTDGATEVTDVEKTDVNKKLVERFVREVLISEDFSKMSTYIRDGVYAQHNPVVEDGPEALQRVISKSGLKNHKIHRVVGEGNFVLTQSEGDWDGTPYAIYDLFRVEDGFIVEHWDVLQEIPSEMAHENGMF